SLYFSSSTTPQKIPLFPPSEIFQSRDRTKFVYALSVTMFPAKSPGVNTIAPSSIDQASDTAWSVLYICQESKLLPSNRTSQDSSACFSCVCSAMGSV